MQIYTVWKDQLLEEYFALEKSSFELFPKLEQVLTSEKVTFSHVEAESMTEAIQLHRDNLEKQRQQEFNPTPKKFLH